MPASSWVVARAATFHHDPAIRALTVFSELAVFTVSSIWVPAAARPIKLRRSAAPCTGRPLTAATTSPGFRPAAAAGDPASTAAISAPRTSPRPSEAALFGSRSWIATPSLPRFTSPCSTSCAMIAWAILLGTANPIPMLPPAGLRIAELIPQAFRQMLPMRHPSCRD